MALNFKITALTENGQRMINTIMAEKLNLRGRMAIGLKRVDDNCMIYTIKLIPEKRELYNAIMSGIAGKPSLYAQFAKEYKVKPKFDFIIEPMMKHG